MATAYHNLSDYDPNKMPDASDMSVGIIAAEWNENITTPLLDGAVETLVKNGVKQENIYVSYVPGTFELTFGARQMAIMKRPDAVITLGCVVRGDTSHFDYVCQGVTQGMTILNTEFDIPFIFGVLTTDTMEQAEIRAGGSLGNKGDECAVAAIKMHDMVRRLK